MGRVSHHVFVIVCSGHHPVAARRIYDKARAIWAPLWTNAQPMMSATGINDDRTIVCPADGGQSNKAPSEQGDAARDELITWLEEKADELWYPSWAVLAMNEDDGRYIDRHDITHEVEEDALASDAREAEGHP